LVREHAILRSRFRLKALVVASASVLGNLAGIRMEDPVTPQRNEPAVAVTGGAPVNAVEWSVSRRADVVIIFSHDTDLLPVVEAIRRIRGDRAVETASWTSEHYKKRIPPRGHVINHALRRPLFDTVEDLTNYGQQARDGINKRRR
jgi:hypothetical protein